MSAQEKTEDITVLIDIQNGFASHSLTEEQGGCLYVPGGEYSGAAASALIAPARNQTFVLSQDFHPDNHISFMTNHPGVMEYREQLLRDAGKDPAEVMNVLELPFTNMVLDADRNIIGVAEGDKIRAVETDARNRITRVLDDFVPDSRLTDSGMQTLWRPHCIQGTESSLFDDSLGLPEGLLNLVRSDQTSLNLTYVDEQTGNVFKVIRKGTNPEIDSYGIALENDGVTRTTAPEVFAQLAADLKAKGVDTVVLKIGGLATNFCVEFSYNNIYDLLQPHVRPDGAESKGIFADQGINAQVEFIRDISHGIPITLPDVSGGIKPWPDLEHTEKRLEALGTRIVAWEKPSPDVTNATAIGNATRTRGAA